MIPMSCHMREINPTNHSLSSHSPPNQTPCCPSNFFPRTLFKKVHFTLLTFPAQSIGCAFTRRLYAYTGTVKRNGEVKKLKPHYHVRLTGELRLDLSTWLIFLKHPSAYCRPFVNFSRFWDAEGIDMYSDASKNPKLGFSAICQQSFCFHQWDSGFLQEFDPSIAYLELYALTIGVMNWIHRFANRRIVLFCNNKSVVSMINHTSSTCKNAMVLIRMIVLKSMIHNVRIFARYVASKDYLFADSLSCLKYDYFRKKSKDKYECLPTSVPDNMWPMRRLWCK